MQTEMEKDNLKNEPANEEQKEEFLQELEFEAWLDYAEEAYREEQQAMAEEMRYEILLEEGEIDESES